MELLELVPATAVTCPLHLQQRPQPSPGTQLALSSPTAPRHPLREPGRRPQWFSQVCSSSRGRCRIPPAAPQPAGPGPAGGQCLQCSSSRPVGGRAYCRVQEESPGQHQQQEHAEEATGLGGMRSRSSSSGTSSR